MGDGKFKWWAGRGCEPESYSGPYDSRDEAIDIGRDEIDCDSDCGFTIVEADKSVMRLAIQSDYISEIIMEQLAENNEECFGEDGPDDPWAGDKTADRDLSKAIEDAVEAWLKAHPGRTWSFGTQRNEEYFPPAVQQAA